MNRLCLVLSSVSFSVLALELPFIEHTCEDEHMIKYPANCMTETNGVETVDPKLIVGNSSNVTLRLDRRGALSLAGTTDAMLQRLFYGCCANPDAPMTNRYADIGLSDYVFAYCKAQYDLMDSYDCFSTGFRDFSSRYRYDARYDAIPSNVMSEYDPVGYGKFQNLNEDFYNDDGYEGVFYWASTSMSDSDVMPGTWNDKFSDMLGGSDAIKAMWSNFSDMEWSNLNSSASMSWELINLGDGPVQHSPFLGLRSGIAHMWWSSTRGQSDKLMIENSLDANSRFSDAEGFFYGQFGDKSMTRHIDDNISPRINGYRLGLANQIVSTMDRTYVGWAVGPRPLYWEEYMEACGELYMTNRTTSKCGAVYITYSSDDSKYHVVIDQLAKPTLGKSDVYTNDLTGTSQDYIYDVFDFDPHHDAGVMIVTATGSVSVEFDPWACEVPFASDLNISSDFEVTDDYGNVVGYWFFNGETEFERVYISSMSFCETRNTKLVLPLGDFSSTTNSHQAKYPIASAFTNGVVKNVKQYPIASLSWATGEDYEYVYKYNIGHGSYDPADRQKYKFRLYPTVTSNDRDTLYDRAMASAGQLVTFARTMCETESGGSMNAAQNLTKRVLADAINAKLPDDFSFAMVRSFTLYHDYGWDYMHLSGGEPTFYDENGFEVQLPKDGERFKVGHVSFEKNLGNYVEHENPFVNTGVTAEMMFPRKTDFKFKAMNLKKDNE